MGYGAAKRPGLGFFRIDVNPLVIMGGICKLIDLRLRDADQSLMMSWPWLSARSENVSKVFMARL